MREKIPLSDAEIEAAFLGLGACTDVVYSHQTLADFDLARQGYARPGQVVAHSERMIVLDDVQVSPKHPRRMLVVVDFGDVRGVLWCA